MGNPSRLRVDIVADARGVHKGTADADSALSKLGGRATKVGVAIGAGLAAAGAAAVAFGVATVKAASDAEQNLGAVESVFGKSAAGIVKYAQSSATSVGLSTSSYEKLAATVGSQLQGMGVAQDKSVGKTAGLIKVGADLSATFGGSVADAVGAVGSLLRGESDPIERYGVAIKASDVSARLAAQGLGGLTGAALKQASAQATLQLLTEKTKTSVGAFSRESDTLAHKQQVLGAQFDNVKVKVGNALLPVISKLFGFLTTTLFPALQRIGQHLVQQFGPAFARVGAFIDKTLVPAFRTVAAFVMGTLVPTFQRTLSPILAGIGNYVRQLTSAVQNNRGSFIKLWEGIKPVIAFLASRVAPVVGKIIGAAFGIMGKAVGVVVGTMATLIDIISTVLDKLGALASAVRNSPLGKFASSVGGFLGKFVPGSAQLSPMTVPLTGGTGTLDSIGMHLATASLTDPGTFSMLSASSSSATVVVDRRSFPTTVNVSGALDGPAVARQLAGLLADNAVRLGHVTAYGAR